MIGLFVLTWRCWIFSLGHQPGFTKYPRCLCMWDTRWWWGPYSVLHEEVLPLARVNCATQWKKCNQRLSGGQKQETFPTTVHQARQFTNALNKNTIRITICIFACFQLNIFWFCNLLVRIFLDVYPWLFFVSVSEWWKILPNNCHDVLTWKIHTTHIQAIQYTQTSMHRQ